MFTVTGIGAPFIQVDVDGVKTCTIVGENDAVSE
jgi:hypothetical protein